MREVGKSQLLHLGLCPVGQDTRLLVQGNHLVEGLLSPVCTGVAKVRGHVPYGSRVKVLLQGSQKAAHGGIGQWKFPLVSRHVLPGSGSDRVNMRGQRLKA